jgi:CRISPR-associated protein Cas5t
MLRLFVQAPFAAFRSFTAGWYRPTAHFITPSAAYGLALNLAGIETRRDDGLSPMTLTQFNLPPARIAVGADPRNPRGPYPSVHTVYQQLHNYPVGASGKERQEDAKGNKYNITPVRREFLSDIRAYILLDFFDHPEIEDRIRKALRGESARSSGRYGLPFLGDNAFLIDRVDVCESPVEALWYRRVESGSDTDVAPQTTRLTIWIDRADLSKTRSALFAPDEAPSEEAPDPSWTAWTLIAPPAGPSPSARPRGKRG